MPTPPVRTCSDCKYFQTEDETNQHKIADNWGYCKSAGPQSYHVHAVAKSFYLGKWPLVRADTTECGAFSP
jgi:hypothetical protein